MTDNSANALVCDSRDPSAATALSDQLMLNLSRIRILPRRLLLDTAGMVVAVPMLRGVWGAALHDLDSEAYRTVFAPQSTGKEEASPLFVLRAALADPAAGSAVDWISIGIALHHDTNLRRAWDVACDMGLGPRRRRFHVRQVVPLRPDGTPAGRGDLSTTDVDAMAWTLDAVVLPFHSSPNSSCRLTFPAPLRLRRYGQLIEQPTLPDLIAAATRRIGAYLPIECRAAWKELSREALELARSTPAGVWRGSRLDLHRYSARQESELDLQGVAGSLDLPRGPGDLWPLLAAAQWLHLGKSTVMGLGQLQVE